MKEYYVYLFLFCVICVFVFFFFRWDNGESEKMSPWDMEPIHDEGKCVCVRERVFSETNQSADVNV